MDLPRDSVETMLQQWTVQRPDLELAGMAVVLRTLLVAGLLAERLKDILAPHDLAPWEFDVLSALRRSPGPLSAGELAESAQLTSGGMTHRLDRLEEQGLVRRHSTPEDRRRVQVSLTPSGQELVDSVLGARMEDASRSLDALSPEERLQLARLLRRWNAGLGGE